MYASYLSDYIHLSGHEIYKSKMSDKPKKKTTFTKTICTAYFLLVGAMSIIKNKTDGKGENTQYDYTFMFN